MTWEEQVRDWPEFPLLNSFSGKLAFDIGAQTGSTATVLLENFAKVVSLEPAWETYVELHAMEENHPGLTTLMVAVSTHEGTVKLAEQWAPMLAHTLTDGHDRFGPVQQWREVPCTTIDALTGKYGTPDFIKIDTEGWELAIIHGALQTLADHKPDLYVEIHHEDNGTQIREIVEGIYGQEPEITDLGIAPEYYWLTWRMNGHPGG